MCQSFRVSLAAGLSLVDVFKQQAKKGPLVARPVISRIAARLDEGDSIEDILKVEGKHFPPLFVGMVAVGEQTGMLAEIFRELEILPQTTHLAAAVPGSIVWPVMQFVGAHRGHLLYAPDPGLDRAIRGDGI